MSETQTDYSEAYDILYRLDKRVRSLEKDSLFIEKKISFLNEKSSKDSLLLSSDLKLLRENLTVFKTRFAQCVHIMSGLSIELKKTIKQEDMVALNARLDEIKFEEYVTQSDVKRGV